MGSGVEEVNMTFPIYLDHQVATRPFSLSLEKLAIFSKDYWGSMHSPHQRGQQSVSFANKSMQSIYESLGAGEGDYFNFTSSGPEAIHQVLFSTYLDVVRESGKNHFLTTPIEEAPIYSEIKKLEKLGCSGKMLPLNSKGQLTKEALLEALRPRAALVSLSWANGLTGIVHPLHDLVEACQERGVRIHVDASHVIGKMFFRFQDLGVDYMTFEGSLLHAPKGCGGLLQKRSSMALPPFFQEANIPLLAALAIAMEQVQVQFEHVATETARLKHLFEQEMIRAIPDSKVLFADVERLPHITCIAFPGVASDSLLYSLSKKGVYATCGGGRLQKLSSLLEACNIEKQYALSSLSFALSHETTEKEINEAISIIVECVKKLRNYSMAL